MALLSGNPLPIRFHYFDYCVSAHVRARRRVNMSTICPCVVSKHLHIYGLNSLTIGKLREKRRKTTKSRIQKSNRQRVRLKMKTKQNKKMRKRRRLWRRNHDLCRSAAVSPRQNKKRESKASVVIILWPLKTSLKLTTFWKRHASCVRPSPNSS